jgi:outer membrane receptor protein involved in Fe transport
LELDFNSIQQGSNGGHIKAMVNAPLDNGSALRAVLYSTEYGGYIDAYGENGAYNADVNTGSRDGARIAITFSPSDNLTITPRLIYQEIDADGYNRQEVFNLFANPYTTTRTPRTFKNREQHLMREEGYSDTTKLVDVVVEAGFDGYDLTFVGSSLERDIVVSRDATALTSSVWIDIGYPDAQALIPSNLIDTTDLEQTTAELRFSSNTDGQLQWLFGVFYSDTQRDYAQRLPTPNSAAGTDALLGAGTSAAVANGFPNLDSPFNSDLPYDIEQTAVFGEVTYDVNDKLQMTFGGRYYNTDEVRVITTGGLFANGDAGQVNETSSSGFTPRVLAKYNLNENTTLNAQISQGFRLGGVNDPLNTPVCSAQDLAIFGGYQDYGDETLWNYEVGVKSTLGNGATLNAAAFYADMEDLQVTLDAGSCSSRITFNVPEAKSSGVEIEYRSQPTDNLELSIAASVINAKFKSTVMDATGSVLGGLENGNRLASVPEVQLAATTTYLFPLDRGDGFVSATVHYIGDRITQPGDQRPGEGNYASGLAFGGASGADVTSLDLTLASYTILNFRAGVTIDNGWEAAIYMNNATDENANLSFDRERGGRARLGFRTNQPRTIGVTVRRSF